MPIAVVLVVIAAVVVAVVASGGDDDEGQAADTTTVNAGATDPADAVMLEPALSYPRADAEGTADEIEWGDRCDTENGRIALPLFPQQFCFAPFEGGDNGGETSPGVSADTIKVVVYLTQADDPVLRFIYNQIGNDDTPDDSWATYLSYAEILNHYYETYGRKVELIRYDATGTISDSVAATADAETIANDIRPFMVLNGPLLTNAFADTLAQNQVMCVSCTPGQPAQWYIDRAPYVWDIAKSQNENQIQVAEYIGKRLAGDPAKWAGDPALTSKERVFGYVGVDTGDQSKQLREEFQADLQDNYDVEFAAIETYALPTDLAGSGRDVITRLKEAGVTSVVFQGDPLAPQTLTKVATEQGYFPEWIITGSVLVDTTAFSRSYDQEQWSHAFGPSNLFARVDPNTAGSRYLHDWYYGEQPPADQSSAVILPNLQFIYNPLQAIGTDVTPENFEKVLFGAPILPSTPVTPQISYGNRGIWPFTDYSALDDQTEVWWDPTATGVDELDKEGVGMWRYVDNGKRYLPGEWPDTAPNVFVEEGSVTIFPEAPPEAA
ncbi:MAG TPA: hypothetical protein VJM33_14755, partial [Microthrixaceae bacterium]|nr:hypothetical protein [Microthrixaceae bacterium]